MLIELLRLQPVPADMQQLVHRLSCVRVAPREHVEVEERRADGENENHDHGVDFEEVVRSRVATDAVVRYQVRAIALVFSLRRVRVQLLTEEGVDGDVRRGR